MWQLSPRFMAVKRILRNCSLASKFYYSVQDWNGLYDRAMTISFLRHFRSRPSVFYREVKSFLKYNSFGRISGACIGNERGGSELDDAVTFPVSLSVRACTCRRCKNFTHNIVSTRMYTHVYTALRFEISTRGIVHSYITFPANGSGRLEWDRSAERRAKAFLIFLEPETRWLGRLFLIIDRISAAAANVLIRDHATWRFAFYATLGNSANVVHNFQNLHQFR